MSPQDRAPPPELRPGYLFAVAVIWLAIVTSLTADPAPQPVQIARLDCASR